MSISDDDFDKLPSTWGTTLEQKIVTFLGKERRGYTAEEVINGIGPEIVVHHKMPGPYPEIPYGVGESTIHFAYSLKAVTDALEGMVQELDGSKPGNRPLEARNKDDERYYRLLRD